MDIQIILDTTTEWLIELILNIILFKFAARLNRTNTLKYKRGNKNGKSKTKNV